MTDVRLSPMTAADAPALAALHQDCFPEEPWSPTAWRDLLAMPGALGLWLQQAEQAQALVLLRRAEDEAEILTLAVAPALRRQGLARQLLAAAASTLVGQGVARLFLEVAVNNEAARALYQSLGFAVVGRRRAYYQQGTQQIDALVLSTPLPLP